MRENPTKTFVVPTEEIPSGGKGSTGNVGSDGKGVRVTPVEGKFIHNSDVRGTPVPNTH